MGWLDSNGLRRVWENIRAALAEKQDKLAGAAGQVVGFGADGKPAAQSTAGLVGPQGPQGEPGPQGPAGADGAQGSVGPAGADGKSAYQYAVDGGYTGTETGFKALMADAATKAYVDSLIEQVKANMMKAMEKIACLVILLQTGEQRTNVNLEFHNTVLGYSLAYSGTLPYIIGNKIVLEPPPGYAFTGLADTWLPALKIDTEYRIGTLDANGAITFVLQPSDANKSFTFVSMSGKSSPARFKLEVA